MQKHVFLTGEIQIGKSTALQRFLEKNGAKAYGFLTRFSSREEERELFIYRFDTERGAYDGKVAVKMNRSGVELFSEVFSQHGAEIIKAAGQGELVIMDELGVFEERAPEFKNAVFETLDGAKRVFGVIKLKASPFLDAIRARDDVELITVTVENRDGIPELLEQRFSAWGDI